MISSNTLPLCHTVSIRMSFKQFWRLISLLLPLTRQEGTILSPYVFSHLAWYQQILLMLNIFVFCQGYRLNLSVFFKGSTDISKNIGQNSLLLVSKIAENVVYLQWQHYRTKWCVSPTSEQLKLKGYCLNLSKTMCPFSCITHGGKVTC